MKIESILRRKGGTFVTIGETTYHFEPQDDGREIAEVTDEDHIGHFLSIKEGYRIPKKSVAPDASAVATTQTTDPAPANQTGEETGDNETDGEQRESSHDDGLHIHHVGRGRWAVFDGDERKSGSMSKDEAQAELDKLIAADDTAQEG